MADLPSYSTPRWVKLVGIIALVLVLLVGIMLVVGGGKHGPGRHSPSGDGGGQAPPADRHAPPEGDGDHKPPPGVRHGEQQP